MNEKYILEGKTQVLISKSELEELKSKFICYVYNVENLDQINHIVNNISCEHKKAKHIVYAYRLVNTGRYTDDREPKGTAGRPIYDYLEGKRLVNVLVIVVRYFGGVLLGTGLLTRTYLGVARNAIEKCKKQIYIQYEKIKIQVKYSELENTVKNIEAEGSIIESKEFGDVITLTVKKKMCST